MTVSVSGVAQLFLLEAVGGALIGLILGMLAFYLLYTVDNYHLEILISLALVAGGYALADRLHLSGPIAMVVAALIVGNHGREIELLLAGVLMIPALLAVRFVSVGIPIAIRRRFREFTPHATKILTWGGLRGGISVALALSIPKTLHGAPVSHREVILAVTYSIVVFSIIVQGLTVGPFVRRLLGGPTAPSLRLSPRRRP